MGHVKQRYEKIENNDNYRRDTTSGAIVSVDRSEYDNFVKKRNKEKSFDRRLDNVEKSLDMILQTLESMRK